jgi:diaminopimelate decarboxylase
MWWERPGLDIRDGRLAIAGRDAETIARENGTPVYAFDLARVEEQVRALQAAFERRDQPFRMRYALKANRDPEMLAALRAMGQPATPGSVGMDVCSPGEVELAIDNGWLPSEISYTGTNASDRDMSVAIGRGVHMNLDLISQIERYGRTAPGTAIGVRVNPKAGAKWSEDSKSLYSSDVRPTKFGVYREDLAQALEVAREHHLLIDTVHFHAGDGFLTDGLRAFERAVANASEMAAWLASQGCPLVEVNAGGGLGVPQLPGERPLDVDEYADVLIRRLGPLGVTIACEPGDFTAKQSGVLLVEVISVEERLGVTFVGTDAGFNVGPEHFIYASPQPIVLCRDASGGSRARDRVNVEGSVGDARSVTVAGNINEGPDLWGEEVSLPPVREGDILAILNIGSYNRSMAMWHCLRPPAPAVFFTDRT